MRRTLPLLFLPLFCFLLLSAFAPYVTHTVTVRIDGETLDGREIRTEASHYLRVKSAGGYERLYAKLRRKYTPKESLNYLGVGLGDYLSAECERRTVDPLDATLEWTAKTSDPFIYYKERAGRQADLDETGRKVARAMDIGGVAEVFSKEIAPDVTVTSLKARTALMGEYATTFTTSGENRRHNIALAAAAVNGTVLEPNEVFSFNAVVGERTAERGFRSANVIVQGEYKKGVGGGVCQVSTTLYNAVLLAGIDPLHAAAHSRPVSYAEASRDCTVSSVTDFTFVNTTPAPLYLAAEVKGSTLTFRLFGLRGEGTYALKSEIVERIPFRCVDESGAVLEDLSERTLLKAGREGVASVLYRTHTVGGVSTTVPIRENRYPPKDAVYSAVRTPPSGAESSEGASRQT